MQPLTPAIIVRETCRLAWQAPWELKGIFSFEANCVVHFAREDLLLSLDNFSERVLHPCVIHILRTKKLYEIKGKTYTQFAREKFRETECQINLGYTETSCLFEMEIIIKHQAPKPSHKMPTYFWLGKQAEIL